MFPQIKLQAMASQAVPLCLPNNCSWDPLTGEYSQDEEQDRDPLWVVDAALDRLRQIKGPVCVVSIAGPARKGKSYILSKAFDQGEVFPLGHCLDPETMGIWLWVVPQKYKVGPWEQPDLYTLCPIFRFSAVLLLFVFLTQKISIRVTASVCN